MDATAQELFLEFLDFAQIFDHRGTPIFKFSIDLAHNQLWVIEYSKSEDL